MINVVAVAASKLSAVVQVAVVVVAAEGVDWRALN